MIQHCGPRVQMLCDLPLPVRPVVRPRRRPGHGPDLCLLHDPSSCLRLVVMIAILGGLGAASLWAMANLSSSRSSRMIGASSTVAWMMLVGLAVTGLKRVRIGNIKLGDLPPVSYTHLTLPTNREV